MNWYVIHTKPRSEKRVEEQLLSMGINAYCPTRNEIRLWSDRKKRIQVPVLPSMVLVNFDEKDIVSKYNFKPEKTKFFIIGKCNKHK